MRLESQSYTFNITAAYGSFYSKRYCLELIDKCRYPFVLYTKEADIIPRVGDYVLIELDIDDAPSECCAFPIEEVLSTSGLREHTYLVLCQTEAFIFYEDKPEDLGEIIDVYEQK